MRTIYLLEQIYGRTVILRKNQHMIIACGNQAIMINFFQMPHFLWDSKVLAEKFDIKLSVYERVVLVHIVRKTVGWGKIQDAISYSQFVNELGISKRQAIKVIQSLDNKGLIVKTKKMSTKGDNDSNGYELHPEVIAMGNEEKVVHDVLD